ncbi:MAG: hypothetical protein MJ238_03675 [Bacilli bacterium]|nr:hypothetical protein [Bacilli bacterium]
MKKALKETLIIAGSSVAAIGLIFSGGISRLVYSIYDGIRTKDIISRFENGKTDVGPVEKESFHKQVYMTIKEEGDKKTTDLLVFTAKDKYELTHYEEITTASSSYSSDFFHMSGDYSREGNIVTVTPGIGVYSINTNNGGFQHYNAEYLTKEDAGDLPTRDEVYKMKYSSYDFALMADGTFVMGGTSDSSEVLGAPEGRRVYSTKTTQGRITMKTLITLDNGTYIVYSQATNSNNAEQTTGAFYGSSTYTIADNEKGIVPDEAKPEETYDIVRGVNGLGYMYANNNGSHMQFDLRGESQFAQWLGTSFNATSPTFYVTESGFTIKIGALKTVVEEWGLYVPATEVEDNPGQEEAKAIHLEVASSIEDKPFVLDLNPDGTRSTGWTNYAQTVKEGTWYSFGNSIVINVDGYASSSTLNSDGSVSISVNYGQMGEKTYSMSKEQLAEAKKNSKPITVEVASSIEDKPFVIEFRDDGTLTTGWTNYSQTLKDGKWSVKDGEIVIDVDYETTIVANVDGSLTATVNYGQMGSKEFTISKSVVDILIANAKISYSSIRLEVASSVEDKPFILEFKEDGSLTTGWTNYPQTVKDGTWSIFNGVIFINVDGYTSACEYKGDGTVAITVNYGQMGEKTYSMNADQYSFLKTLATPLHLEVASSAEGKPFILEFTEDGKVTTGWTNYAQTVKEGTWSFEGDSLVITVEGYTSTVAANEDGTVSITINYGQMGDKAYTLSAEQYAALKPASSDIHLEVASSAEGKPFILDIKSDGTVTTGWTNYAQTVKDGTWTVFGGKIVITVAGYSSKCVLNEDGSASITVNYGQMGDKTYTLSAAQYAALATNETPIHAEVASSAEGKPFVLDINGDGTLSTGWTNYAQTVKSGTWSCFNGNISFNVEGYKTTFDYKADGTVDVTINYGQMGDKVYTLSAEQYNAIKANGSKLHYEVASSAEGKPFILEFTEDGKVTTGWTNYAQTVKEGTWSKADGKLVITVEGYTATVTVEEDGSASVKINYGQMGDKVYTVPAADLASLLA